MKRVTFGLREAMMAMVVDDLKVVKAIGPEDTALISIATQQLALAAVKAADAAHTGLATTAARDSRCAAAGCS